MDVVEEGKGSKSWNFADFIAVKDGNNRSIEIRSFLNNALNL